MPYWYKINYLERLGSNALSLTTRYQARVVSRAWHTAAAQGFETGQMRVRAWAAGPFLPARGLDETKALLIRHEI